MMVQENSMKKKEIKFEATKYPNRKHTMAYEFKKEYSGKRKALENKKGKFLKGDDN